MASLYPYSQPHLTQGITSGVAHLQNPNHAHLQHAQHHLRSYPQQQILLQQQQAQAQQQLRQQHQLLEKQQQQQHQQQMEYQRMQNVHPLSSPKSSYPSQNNTLQQRRASSQLPNSTLALSASIVAEARNEYQNQGRMPVQTQPLSPQDWQGLVASGAQPVRQALHSFIATSCEKPPETKEEARAVLEVMFQIRANMIRQAIEEGQLATTEALKHRVIQRRESVIEGSSRNLKRENIPRAMSAPTENSLKFTTNTSGIDSQSLLNLQMTEEPDSMVVDNSSAEFRQGMSPVGLFGEQASTFGLSDDDLMSSFTTFTAKLGDSILAKSPLYAPKHGGILDNGNHTMDHDHLEQSIPSLSPPSKELSPTTSNGSPSNSPWMSWTTEGQRFNVQQTFGAPRPGMAVDMQQMYTGVQPSFTTSPEQNSINLQTGYPQNQFAQRGGAEVPEDKQYQPYQHHQVDTWNQYMQYLLHQQELGLQLPDQNVSQPLGQYSQQIQVAPQIYQQPLDPHWQATMMTMMMNQNSGVSSIGESDRGLLANNASNMVLPPGLNYGQQPPL